MVKIIHTADLHLDSPFSLFDIQKAQVRRNELRGAFSSLILYAKTEKADIMILSGDLFDSGFVTKETVSLMVSQFASLPECRFVITPGNHDPADKRSPYLKTEFPSNVYIFESETVSRFSFPELGVDVYGYAFTSSSMTENPLKTPFLLDRDRINILAAHADVGGTSDSCPLTKEDLARHGFDYIALGHIHKGTDIQTIGDTYYAYSGCLEGRSFDECGIKGVIIGEFEKKHGRLQASFGKRRLCKRHYEKMSLDISGIETAEDLKKRISSSLAKENYGMDVLLRLRLTGRVSPELLPAIKGLHAENTGLFYLEVENATAPLLNTEALKNDISIRGALYRELLPMLESENEEEREIASEALRLGLAALDGEDIVDF